MNIYIPNEILMHILSYVDGYVRETMRLVCKLFHSFAYNGPKDNYIRDREVSLFKHTPEELAQVARYGYADIYLKMVKHKYYTYYIKDVCIGGNVTLFKYILHMLCAAGTSSTAICVDAYLTTCKYGHMDLFLYISSISNMPGYLIPSCLINACRSGNMELAMILSAMYGKDDYVSAFRGACVSGNIALIDWLIITMKLSNDTVVSGMHRAYEHSQFDVVRHLYSKGYVLEHYGLNVPQNVIACKLLLECSVPISVIMNNPSTYITVDNLKYLLSLGGVITYSAFIHAFVTNNNEIITFIYDRYRINKMDLRDVIKKLCVTNNVTILRMILRDYGHAISRNTVISGIHKSIECDNLDTFTELIYDKIVVRDVTVRAIQWNAYKIMRYMIANYDGAITILLRHCYSTDDPEILAILADMQVIDIHMAMRHACTYGNYYMARKLAHYIDNLDYYIECALHNNDCGTFNYLYTLHYRRINDI